MTERIVMQDYVADFAENKDVAKKLRIERIMPALSVDKKVVMDFEHVTGATQSFIHALISDPIRQFRDHAFKNLIFKDVNPDIREIISIVYRYMQESLEGEVNE